MPKTQKAPVWGTTKVGRWAYPARKYADGTVERNTKTDGSGEFVAAPAGATFIANPHQTVTSLDEAKTPAKAATKAPKKAARKASGSKAPTGGHGHTWVLGGRCAKNLHTLTEQNLYVMPSGRHQCKDCRKAYRSNQAASA